MTGGLAMVGPAFAVSVGYVDPGNWATDLVAGVHGYSLLWAVVGACLLAMLLQVAVTHLTVWSGVDLATHIARTWPRLKGLSWVMLQGVAIMTDLAEFTGIALGAQLVLGLGRAPSVALALVATFVLLATSKRLEALMIAALGALCVAFAYQVHALPVDWTLALGGLRPVLPSHDAWILVVGIVGATVMPHNLFLHSSLVMRRCQSLAPDQRPAVATFFTRETLVALTVAGLVNTGILVVGAALHGSSSIEEAHARLTVVAGPVTALIFGAALLLSGITSSATATLSGDFIFAALSPVRVSPVLRRLLTAGPAAVALVLGADATTMLVASQVALSLALPVALVPMLFLMRDYCAPRRHRPLWVGAVTAAVLCLDSTR